MDHASPQVTPSPRVNPTVAAVGYVLAGAAALALAYVGTSDVLLAIAAGVVGGLACWMLVSDRYEWTLLVLLGYLGLFDGVLKLRLDRGGVTLLRDVLLYSIVLGAIARWVSRRETYRWPPYTAWVAAWFGVVVIQLVNSANGGWGHTLSALRPHLEFVPLFFLGYEVLRNERRLRVFFIALAAVASVNGVVAVYQVQLSRSQLSEWGPGYAKLLSGEGCLSPRAFVDSNKVDHPRPPALGSDMGFSGTLGAIAAPGALALLWWSRRRRRSEFALAVALLAGVATAVAVSTSRLAVIQAAGLLALGIFAVIATRRSSHAIAMTGAAALIVAGGMDRPIPNQFRDLRPLQVHHAESRRTNGLRLQEGLAQARADVRSDFPFGAGLGSVGPARGSTAETAGSNGANGETEFTFLMVELGIAGLLVLLLLHLRVATILLYAGASVACRERSFLPGCSGSRGLRTVCAWLAGPTTATSPAAPFLWIALGTLAFFSVATIPGS